MTWNDFWESVSVLQFVGWALGILGIIAFFVKGWPKIVAFVKVMDSLAALPQFMVDTTKTLEEQNTKIAEIHHEVNYNNGSSVKDALERVELGVKGLYDRADKSDKSDAEIREELERTRPKPPRTRATKPKE